MAGIVAIVGRPNVGKSTLFNRFTEKRTAIVDDVSGVTRDRLYDSVEWEGNHFDLIDTGGFVPNSNDIFEKAISEQVKIAIEEADILLFMVDVRTGITKEDEEFAKILKRSTKPVLVVCNKSDNDNYINDSYEFYRLGFQELYPVSSTNGTGTSDLLDQINEILKDSSADHEPFEETSDLPAFAILGRPNAGKSTLINALLDEERNLVTDIPGTTRDSISSYYQKFGREFKIIDTAGLRKKSKINEDLEYYSVVRALKAIEEANVCFLLIDAHHGLETQDLKIIQLVIERKRGLVILINKWDAVEKDEKTHLDYQNYIRNRLSEIPDVPVKFISALNKQRLFKAIEKGLEVHKNLNRRVSTHQLNEELLPEIHKNPPPSHKGNFVKINYVNQFKQNPPGFIFFCNHPKAIHQPYKKFLENKLRGMYSFEGVPIQLKFRHK